MTSVLFLTEAIYYDIFRCSYTKKQKYFLNFFWHFENLFSILNIFKKKDDPCSWYIFEFTDSEKRA